MNQSPRKKHQSHHKVTMNSAFYFSRTVTNLKALGCYWAWSWNEMMLLKQNQTVFHIPESAPWVSSFVLGMLTEEPSLRREAPNPEWSQRISSFLIFPFQAGSISPKASPTVTGHTQHLQHRAMVQLLSCGKVHRTISVQFTTGKVKTGNQTIQCGLKYRGQDIR